MAAASFSKHILQQILIHTDKTFYLHFTVWLSWNLCHDMPFWFVFPKDKSKLLIKGTLWWKTKESLALAEMTNPISTLKKVHVATKNYVRAGNQGINYISARSTFVDFPYALYCICFVCFVLLLIFLLLDIRIMEPSLFDRFCSWHSGIQSTRVANFNYLANIKLVVSKTMFTGRLLSL